MQNKITSAAILQTSAPKLLMLIGVLGLMLIVFSACREKCVPGASIYPECLEKPIVPEHELVVWNLYEDEDVYQEQFSKFTKEYPMVKIKYQSFPDAKEYKNALIKQLALGNGPDIFAMPYGWVEENIALLAPAPITTGAAGEQILTVDPEVYRELFHQAISEVLIRTVDGVERVFGVALYLDTLALYYNGKALNGAIPEKYSPAASWTEMRADAAKMTKRDSESGAVIRSGIALGSGKSIRYAPDIISLLFVQYGASIYDEAMRKSILAASQDSTPSQSTETPAKEAFKLYTSFTDKGARNYSWDEEMAADDTAELGAFLRGDIAMLFGYSDLTNELEAARKTLREAGENGLIDTTEIRHAKAPQLVSDNNYQWPDISNIASFNGFFVAAQSEHRASAWALILQLADTDSARTYAEKTERPPARRDITEEVLRNGKSSRKAKIFADQAKTARALITGDPDDFAVIMRSAADIVAKGELSIEDALQQAEERLQCVLERIKGDATKANCTTL